MQSNSQTILPHIPVEFPKLINKQDKKLEDKIAIIIPAFKPQESILFLISSLLTKGNFTIIVVDDGSGKEFEPIFNSIPENIYIIKHAVNLGKGAALKSAFNYVLLHFPDLKGVVTADADGQHLTEDIIQVGKKLFESEKSLVIGVRVFTVFPCNKKRKIPLRSKFGNIITKQIFRFCVGKSLSDTQSGLRGLNTNFLPSLMRINSNRYEFELEMLIKARDCGYDYKEVPIETVYLDNNESSHFNPLLDSLKIYFVLFRYITTSLLSALIDNIIFAVTFYFSNSLISSMIFARIISGLFQFSANKSVVFKSGANIYKEAIKYILVLIA
jgi:glycosyltransferase involved in cell wall biosynthesis